MSLCSNLQLQFYPCHLPLNATLTCMRIPFLMSRNGSLSMNLEVSQLSQHHRQPCKQPLYLLHRFCQCSCTLHISPPSYFTHCCSKFEKQTLAADAVQWVAIYHYLHKVDLNRYLPNQMRNYLPTEIDVVHVPSIGPSSTLNEPQTKTASPANDSTLSNDILPIWHHSHTNMPFSLIRRFVTHRSPPSRRSNYTRRISSYES